MITNFTTGFYTKLRLWPTTWAATTAYAVGNIVKPTTYASHAYKCTTAGTSASSEPTWSTTNGGTTSDGTVTWTTFDTLTYNTLAPQTASLPYITFGLLTDMPMGAFQDTALFEDMTFYVNIFSSTSVAHALSIGDLIKTAMDNTTLTITSYTSMRCMREYTGNVSYNPDDKVFSIPMRYRVWGSK